MQVPTCNGGSRLGGRSRSHPPSVEIVEPRCRICRNSAVRRAVNGLLDWRGAPLPDGGTIGYQDILTAIRKDNLVPSYCGRLTYTSLWNHAQRHHDQDSVTAYWTSRLNRELSEVLATLNVFGDAPQDAPC